jgi:hypothetical protein
VKDGIWMVAVERGSSPGLSLCVAPAAEGVAAVDA